ncbi:MAG TPA: O-antigen ligase family protein [Terriglobia bacterium]|nr:O-antigen ligase family protein [Terriglobia bacterium]
MPPTLALMLWAVLLLVLLRFDPAREPNTSWALWVPVIWISILGSRLPSQWLGSQVGVAAKALEEGNPIDRTVSLLLILLAIGILLSRSFNWLGFFSRNLALMAFLLFAVVSVAWSDFPLVAFKRWVRDLGNYFVLLVALSDPCPVEAIRTVLRRLSYLLIPLSVVLIKYYPEIGKSWDPWTGIAQYSGVTTGKNMLGALCLVCGLFFFWDTVTRWADRKAPRTRRIIQLNVAFIAMAVWLLELSNSATSSICLVLGCLIIAAARSKTAKRRPIVLTLGIPVAICFYLTLAFGFGLDLKDAVAQAVGRDPTLTDRTKIWSFLLSMKINPLLGVGYESFWLGPRLEWFWQNADLGHINEAHNGYLEVYLNLGIVGLFFLGWFVIASYWTISRRFARSCLGPLCLSVWAVTLLYSATEAGFRTGLVWLTFLMGAIGVPERTSNKALAFDTSAFESGGGKGLSSVPLSHSFRR